MLSHLLLTLCFILHLFTLSMHGAYTVGQSLLDLDEFAKGDFGRAANWADAIKLDLSYRWSLQLHFVDMGQEHTPDTCRDYTPDRCPNDACLVGALQNYTERVKCHQLPNTRREAIKFLLHFMGDIAQPLHSGGYARVRQYLDQMEQDLRYGKFAKWRQDWLRCFLSSETLNITECAIDGENSTLEFSTQERTWVDTFIARAIIRSVYY
ncbi:S1/P1 nuclease-domain-containing protein [Syncephalis plumigaleata]|nr:S1/P1 nuclease-domain-containing protein [Syncephalis plumigaleata]